MSTTTSTSAPVSWVVQDTQAVVRICDGSEPQPGSVIAMARIRSPHFFFCSSVPAACSAALPRPRSWRRMRTE